MDLILGACYQYFFHVATPVHPNSTVYSIIFNLKNNIAEEVMKNVCNQHWLKIAWGLRSQPKIENLEILQVLKVLECYHLCWQLKLNTINEFNHGQLLFINFEQTSTEKLLAPHGTSQVLSKCFTSFNFIILYHPETRI